MSDRSFRFPRQRWQIATPQPDHARQLAQATQLPPLLAQVLMNRDVSTVEAARTYLDPELQALPSPLEEFPDLPIALDLLLRAIATRQPIAICGDYDADGMTSTALLLRALRFMGAIVDYAIPSRMQEGYGINQRIVEEFYQEGVQLILTVDNGIAAYEPIARARELGLTVIVTDHHDIPEKLPPANAILNPKLIAATSPYHGVAGVGVAYILAICLSQCLQKTQDLTAPLLELFTLGTIADLAPLTGVNRRWVRRGLRLLPRSRIPGIQALIQVAGLSNEKELKPEAIGFRLGPRINAIGRIADPQIVIELLTTEDDGRALELAMKCEQVNQLRQRLCELIEQEAIAWCEQRPEQSQRDRVLVVVQPEWHHGVIGIVASRLVERYGVPVFIGTYEGDDRQHIRGSARGIPEFHVFEAMQACESVLEKFGGHRAAGGFSLKAENLEALRSQLSQFAHRQLQPDQLRPLIKIDAQANFSDLTLSLYECMNQLHPCGVENPDPVFWTPNVRIVEQQTIGRDQSHLKLTLMQGGDDSGSSAGGSNTLRAIAWRWGEYFPLPSPLDVAYKLRLNEWNHTKSVELELVGVRRSQPIEDPNPPPARTVERSDAQANAPREVDRPSAKQVQLPFPEGVNGRLNGHPKEMPSVMISPALLELHPPARQAEPPAADSSTITAIEFYYNARKYACEVYQNGPLKELLIRNFEGQMLIIHPQQRRGFLGTQRETVTEIDITHPFYFNLVRAALDALEIAEKNQLLQQQNQRLAEQDRQIAHLLEQLDALQQKFGQLTNDYHKLQTELPAPTPQPESTALEHQPTRSPRPQAVTSPQDLPVSEPLRPSQPLAFSKPEEIKLYLRRVLGQSVWNQLNPQSQKDLVTIYRTVFSQSGEGRDGPPSYLEAALKLSNLVEREIVQPFFKHIQDYLQTQGLGDTIGGVVLRSRKKYTLELLPPLLAAEWQTFCPEALNHPTLLPETQRYDTFLAQSVREADRQTVQAFLKQWGHPVAIWLGSLEAASTIAQLNDIRNLASEGTNPLSDWQFEWLRLTIVGEEHAPGLFQAIYGSHLGTEI